MNVPIVLCLVILIATAAVFGAAPYAQSDYITGMTWEWNSHKRECPGSDNWAITWADDGHQYTTWGDGGGFGGTNKNGRVSLGIARVEGDFSNHKGYNVWGGKNPENKAQFKGKSYGIVSIGGILYMWVGPGSGTASYAEAVLCSSADHGATWTKASWKFLKASDLIMPTIVNYGKDYAGAPDQYVYSYFIQLQGNPSKLNVHKPGKIDLARVPRDHIMEQSYYEFVSGFDNSGNPTWDSDYNNRVPVFEDSDGVGWCFNVSYNAGLGRYILSTEHKASFKANVGFFEAEKPWGPWKTIEYYDDWANGSGISQVSRSFFWNFSNKWASADGKDFVCVFSGTGDMDTYNAIKGSFTVNTTYQRTKITGDLHESGRLTICPNPFNGTAHVRLAPQLGPVRLSIFDAKGRRVRHRILQNTQTLQLNGVLLTPGSYTLVVDSRQKRLQNRFVVR